MHCRNFCQAATSTK